MIDDAIARPVGFFGIVSSPFTKFLTFFVLNYPVTALQIPRNAFLPAPILAAFECNRSLRTKRF